MRGNKILRRMTDVGLSLLMLIASLLAMLNKLDFNNFMLFMACVMYAWVSVSWYRETYSHNTHTRSIDTTTWFDENSVDFHSIGVVDDKSSGSPRREMVLYVDRQSNMFVIERAEFESRFRLAEQCECDQCKSERSEQ
jgi:hypothetical protein